MLEIQKRVEDKRLAIGKKIERFLLQALNGAKASCLQILSSEKFPLPAFLVIVAVSILVQSSRDVGHDSATYLEAARLLTHENGYFLNIINFALPNFFASVCFLAIPTLFAKVFDLNQIICAQIFLNLIGICSIYFSYKILSRSALSKNKPVLNLIILSFAIGFFWRAFVLEFNEFATKSTFFLSLAIPYISYQFIKNENLSKGDQVIIGIFAALITSLKIHYIILIIVFELDRFFKSKFSLSSFLSIRNYIGSILFLSYILLLIRLFPNYISFLPELSSWYYFDRPKLFFFAALAENFIARIFPILLIAILHKDYFKKFDFLRQIFLGSIAIIAIFLLEMHGGLDNASCLYALCLPLVILLIFCLIKDGKINWRKNGFIIVAIFVISQSDSVNFFQLLFCLPFFWWVFVLVLRKKYQEILGKNLRESHFLFLQQTNLQQFLFFCAVAFSGVAVTTLNLFSEIFAIVFIFMSAFYHELYQKFISEKYFSRLSTCLVAIIFSYFFSIYSSAISSSYAFTSPNYLNDQITKIIKKDAPSNDEKIVTIYEINPSFLPAAIYQNKQNTEGYISVLYNYSGWMNPKNYDKINIVNEVLRGLKSDLGNNKTKLIFISHKGLNYLFDPNCQISFLEYYLRDPEFKRLFTKNYVFLNRIIQANKIQKSEVVFFKNDESTDLDKEKITITDEIEVYARK